MYRLPSKNLSADLERWISLLNLDEFPFASPVSWNVSGDILLKLVVSSFSWCVNSSKGFSSSLIKCGLYCFTCFYCQILSSVLHSVGPGSILKYGNWRFCFPLVSPSHFIWIKSTLQFHLRCNHLYIHRLQICPLILSATASKLPALSLLYRKTCIYTHPLFDCIHYHICIFWNGKSYRWDVFLHS